MLFYSTQKLIFDRLTILDKNGNAYVDIFPWLSYQNDINIYLNINSLLILKIIFVNFMQYWKIIMTYESYFGILFSHVNKIAYDLSRVTMFAQIYHESRLNRYIYIYIV